MIGGMGVDISTADLALEAARLGGVGHISDAMVPTVSDRRYDTKFVKNKLKQYKYNVANTDKSASSSTSAMAEEATRLHVARTMDAKRGDGLIFINCMEKLTMNAPKETLKVRMNAALDAGIDGITLAAGLHLGSFGLIEDHPRFRDANSASSSLAARLAAVPAQERPHQPPARLRRRRRPAGRRPPRLRHGLGWSTTWPPSTPKSSPG
jgi:nitronate monooxygenase